MTCDVGLNPRNEIVAMLEIQMRKYELNLICIGSLTHNEQGFSYLTTKNTRNNAQHSGEYFKIEAVLTLSSKAQPS